VRIDGILRCRQKVSIVLIPSFLISTNPVLSIYERSTLLDCWLIGNLQAFGLATSFPIIARAPSGLLRNLRMCCKTTATFLV
jgi:hypothetical protein